MRVNSAELCLERGGAEEPAPVEVSAAGPGGGSLVILRRDIERREDGWWCLNLTLGTPDRPSAEEAARDAPRLWAEGVEAAGGAPLSLYKGEADAALCALYEAVGSMQESYDASLCDIYEAIVGGE